MSVGALGGVLAAVLGKIASLSVFVNTEVVIDREGVGLGLRVRAVALVVDRVALQLELSIELLGLNERGRLGGVLLGHTIWILVELLEVLDVVLSVVGLDTRLKLVVVEHLGGELSLALKGSVIVLLVSGSVNAEIAEVYVVLDAKRISGASVFCGVLLLVVGAVRVAAVVDFIAAHGQLLGFVQRDGLADDILHLIHLRLDQS